MQQNKNKDIIFNKVVGEIFTDLIKSSGKSISMFAREYDFDRGNLSKFLRGNNSCRFITVWKLAEALKIDFVTFSTKLKEKLGKDFLFFDE